MKVILENRARSIWRGQARSLAVALVTVLKSLNDFGLSFEIVSKKSAVDSEEHRLSIKSLQALSPLSLAGIKSCRISDVVAIPVVKLTSSLSAVQGLLNTFY